MKPVYVLSTEGYSGKTGLCASLALEARDRGLSIGYMKPIGTAELVDDLDGCLVFGAIDLDAILDGLVE